MAQPAFKLATYDDLLALPEHRVGEIVHGVLYNHPRPASKHALTGSLLGYELIGPFDKGHGGGPGGWWIVDEPELHLPGDNIVVPDLAGWRRERMPVYPDVSFFTLPPDWICEILSPGTEQHDRVRKMPLYAANGVGFLWLINPIERTLEGYQLADHSRWLSLGNFGADDTVRLAPFDAVELTLTGLWA